MGFFSKLRRISLFDAQKRAILPCIMRIKSEKSTNFGAKITAANTVFPTHLINIDSSCRLFPASKNEIATKTLFLPKNKPR